MMWFLDKEVVKVAESHQKNNVRNVSGLIDVVCHVMLC